MSETDITGRRRTTPSTRRCRRWTGLEDQPLRDHVAVFDAVHGALQDRLADAEG